LLADAVVPVGYAVKGERLAADLRRYKSGRDGAADAAGRLRSTLAVFLHARGARVWRAAGMAGPPSAVAVVPSGQGRPGAHPLTGIVASCVELPVTRLTVRLPAGPRHRGISLDWLSVHDLAGGADVLLVDDTWVSGGSAQSAAAALKLAGARHVALVVLGRHVDPADPRSAGLLLALRAAAKPRAGSRLG
jgi:phosphoribosylpyrophosphate synthetase